MSREVLIVGGGVIGLSLAWEMSRRQWKVTLLERGQVGKATSWAAAGILPPANFHSATDPIDQLRGMSHSLFPQWVKQLQTLTSIDVGLRRCGGWYLADTAGERAAMLGMTGYWHDFGIECESVPVDVVAQREPAIGSWITGQAAHGKPRAAWWVPDEYQIRPPRYLQALHQACLQSGVTIIEDSSVDDIRIKDSIATVQTGSHWHQADAVIVCGGAWTGNVAACLNLETAIVPVRGQILLLKSETPTIRSVVNVGQRYVMSRDDGSTLVGSCEEEVGFRPGTDEAMLETLHQFALQLIPDLATAKRVSAWSGFRPLTFDGFPMIGRVPDTNNLYVAAGHFRSGLHLSPGTAVVLADLITGNEPAIPLDPFRVGKQQSHPSKEFTPRISLPHEPS